MTPAVYLGAPQQMPPINPKSCYYFSGPWLLPFTRRCVIRGRMLISPQALGPCIRSIQLVYKGLEQVILFPDFRHTSQMCDLATRFQLSTTHRANSLRFQNGLCYLNHPTFNFLHGIVVVFVSWTGRRSPRCLQFCCISFTDQILLPKTNPWLLEGEDIHEQDFGYVTNKNQSFEVYRNLSLLPLVFGCRSDFSSSFCTGLSRVFLAASSLSIVLDFGYFLCQSFVNTLQAGLTSRVKRQKLCI